MTHSTPTSALPNAGDFHCSCDIDVRFRDLDAMGHVNNAVYFTYFEVSREQYMRALGSEQPPDASLEQSFPFILLEVSCRFLAAAAYGQRLRVHVRTVNIGTKSFEFEYLITRPADDRAIAVGRSTQVSFDYGAGRTQPVPDDLRSMIERLEQRSF